MKEVRDLDDLTVHDVQSMSSFEWTGFSRRTPVDFSRMDIHDECSGSVEIITNLTGVKGCGVFEHVGAVRCVA